MHGVREVEVVFDRGLEQRGSEVQKAVRIIDMWNTWLVKDEIGAVEPIPGDSALITWSALTSQILSWHYGINPANNRIGFVVCSRNGEIRYAYHDGSTTTGALLGSIAGADWTFAGIVRVGIPQRQEPGSYKQKFLIFQGNEDRVGQATEVGTTTIDDIGVERPTISAADIYLTKTTSTTNVKGLVRYYISEVEGGEESALSERIPRFGALSWKLYFNGTEDQIVNWSNDDIGYTFDIDYTSHNRSIEFMWRATDVPPAKRSILYKLTGTQGWEFHVGGQGKMNFTLGDGTNTHTVTTPDSVCDGRWHRFTATYEFTGKTLKLYKDGELQDSDTCSSLTSGTMPSIGIKLGVQSSWFEGYVTDIRFYSDDVSAEVVPTGTLYSHMHESIPDVTQAPWTDAATTLTHYYACDEGTGTTLDDAVGAFDGTFDSGNEPTWQKIWSYSDASIDAGDGAEIEVNFVGTKFHGNKYNIYRSLANGVVPFLVGTFTPISTDSVFEDDVPDEEVGDVPYLHGDQPPEEARPAVHFANRVWIADNNRVYWSDLANSESFWVDRLQGNWLDVYPEDGDNIRALAADKDGLVVLKTDHIYKIYGRDPEDVVVRPVAPTASIPMSLGAANMNCVCEVPGGLAILWNKQVYLYQSEASIVRISGPIEDDLRTWSSPSSSYYIAGNVGFDAERNHLWVSIPVSSTGPGYSYIYDMGLGEWIGKRNRGYRCMQTIRAWEYAQSQGWNSDPFIDSVFAGATDGGGVLNDVIQIVDDSTLVYDSGAGNTSYDSHFTLSPFWGSNRQLIKRFLYVDVIYVPTSGAGNFDVTYWVDGKTASADTVQIDMQDANTPDRKTVRVRVNETGRELSLKIGNTPSTDGAFRVLSINYGYQEFESVQ